MIWIVFNRIVQIPDGTTGGTDEILHRTVFKEGSFKRARTHFAAIAIGFARSAGPNLGNVAVAAVEPRETGFGADDAPLGVIEQTMCRHIATDVAARSFVIILDIIEYLLQCAAIEKVFQLASAPTGIHRTIRRLPIFMVVTAPFAFEPFRVTGAIPKFRFLKVNRLGTGIQCALDADAKKLPVVRAGTHVIHIAAVADLVAGAIRLRFVFVVNTIEAAIEVILIFAPRDPGHDVNAIIVRAPSFDARRQVGVNAVNNGDIRTQIPLRTPRLAGLKTSAFENLIGISRKRR